MERKLVVRALLLLQQQARGKLGKTNLKQGKEELSNI